MSSELNTKLTDIKNQKDTYLIPENIKKDVTVLGVTGTLESSIDTSDADATADDMVENKTAYVNGEKLTGTIKAFSSPVNASSRLDTSNATKYVEMYNTDYSYARYIPKRTQYKMRVPYSSMRSTIGLYDDGYKIAKGVTILGLTGTYEGPSEKSIYQFDSIDEMQNYLANLQATSQNLDIGTKADVIRDNSSTLRVNTTFDNTDVIVNKTIILTDEEYQSPEFFQIRVEILNMDYSSDEYPWVVMSVNSDGIYLGIARNICSVYT